MRHRNPRRSQIYAAVNAMIVEHLEPRYLLSSVSTSLQLVTSSLLVVSNTPPLTNGPTSLGTLEVTSKSHSVSVIPSTGDLPSYRYTWKQITGPEGGRASFTKNLSNAARQNTVSFSLAGTYEIQVSVDAAGTLIAEGSLSFHVRSTATRLSVRSPSGQSLTASSGLTVSGTSTQLSAFVLDQFGTILATQPQVTWNLSKSPTGSNPQLIVSEKSADLTFNRAGSYSVTAASGTFKLSVPVNVNQSLTTYTIKTPDKAGLSSGASLSITGTTLKLNFAAFDQFGQEMVTLPAIKWTTTVPTGLKATTSLAKGILTTTYTGAGTFSTQTTIADQTFQFTTEVRPALASLAIQRSDGTTVNSKAPATTSGTRLDLKAIALDQFGQILPGQPEMTWQMTVSPTGSNPKLTTTGSSVLFEPDLSGKYTLRAAAGSVFTE
ncbi:MAG: hypothetical protein ACK58L_05870, partial [Planctomycetota bacterium]